jgi:hypothetical protein
VTKREKEIGEEGGEGKRGKEEREKGVVWEVREGVRGEMEGGKVMKGRERGYEAQRCMCMSTGNRHAASITLTTLCDPTGC